MPSYPGGVGLMIGIPCDGRPENRPGIEWSFGLMNMHPPMNYDIRWSLVKGKPVDEARQMIGEAAIKEGCRYLFFLGTDNTIPPFAIKQLVFHLEHHPKYAVAGCVYVHKAPPQEPMVFRGNGIGPYWDWHIGEVFDVSGLGMDATLIRVEALKNLPKPWFKTIDTSDAWKDGVAKSEHWTEDLFFCDKISKICCHCNIPQSLHVVIDDVTYCSVQKQQVFEGWGIMADGGLLADHWDNAKGIRYTLPQNSKPYRHLNKKGPKKIIDLGCGSPEDSYRTAEGEVLRVDIRENVNPDYRCDIRMTPFANDEFDVVFSSHTLEHFSRMEAEDVLSEMIRIMKKPAGELRLVLPNIKWAAQHIMNNEIDSDVINVLYGAQTYQENFHKMGYTPEMLEQFLRQKGFKSFTWDYENYHMMVRASMEVDKKFELFNPTVIAQMENGAEIAIKPQVSEVAEAAAELDGTVNVIHDNTSLVTSLVKPAETTYDVVNMHDHMELEVED